MSAIDLNTIQWTRRTPALWTGRRADAPAGTIEGGARFTYVDVDGGAHRGYRSLAAAQTAAAGEVEPTTCGPDAQRSRLHPMLFAAATGVLVIDAVLLGGVWLLSL
jgi:hypothetical protein